MKNETVEVPVAWLKKLIKLGEKTDVTYRVGQLWGVRELNQLKGYIESAEALLPANHKRG